MFDLTQLGSDGVAMVSKPVKGQTDNKSSSICLNARTWLRR